MLRKAQRLARSRDIARVQRARSNKNAYFSVRTLPTTGRVSRATVVVAKSVSKKAVERNKLKRQVRAVLAETMPTLQSPVDILVSVKPPALSRSFSELKKALLALLP